MVTMLSSLLVLSMPVSVLVPVALGDAVVSLLLAATFVCGVMWGDGAFGAVRVLELTDGYSNGSIDHHYIAPAFASVYNILSPLGRDYEAGTNDLEAQGVIPSKDSRPNPLQHRSLQKKYSFVLREGHTVAESTPAWVGGLFDFWDDISLAYLSVFCTAVAVFGNMYVHIATFLVYCIAPFFVFNLAAININNETV